ncbi:MAG: O-antigen ligase family protein [Chloroflexota bacterium]
MSIVTRPAGILPAGVDARDSAASPLGPASNATGESRVASIAGRVHFIVLVLVLLMTPFEAGYQPVGRFLWATYTNLEVAMFVLAGALLFKLAVDAAARHRLIRLPLLLPILALLGACVVSTLFGEYKSLGVQFIYRLLMGVLIFASACEALRGKRRLVLALGAFVFAGSVSAVLGLLEFAPGLNMQPYLRAFKPQPTTVGGMVRLSGSFEYANGAAMFFEMTLPVLMGLAIIFSSERLLRTLGSSSALGGRRRLAALVLLITMILVTSMALVLTFSRASLLGVLISLVVFWVVSLVRSRPDRWVRPVVWRALGLALAVMVLSGLFVFATQPMFRLRLTTENDRNWYGATLTAAPLPELSARQVVTVPVTLLNHGQMTWPAGGVLPIHVSYHWLSATQGVYLLFDGLRTPLSRDVAPGETLSVDAIVQAPPKAGDYRLQWDLVHENVTWFEGKQGMKAEMRTYHVGAEAAIQNQPPPQTSMPPPVALETNTDLASVGRGQLWRAAFAMFKAHPITGVGPDGFRNLYGKYAGVDQWNRNIYTNNMYIEMFTNLGLLGGLAFLWLSALILWCAIRSLMREPVGPVWIAGIGVTAALVAFYVHGLVDYFLFSTPIYLAFWFLVAVAVGWPRMSVPGATSYSVLRMTADDRRQTAIN